MSASSSSTEAEPGADAYNITSYYRDVNKALRVAYRHSDLQVGTPAPDFSAVDTSGGSISLAALLAEGDAILVFGCHSAPPCYKELPEIDRMARDLPAGISTTLVYTREIHPNEELPYGTFPHHRSFADKLAAARRFKHDLGLSINVAVDDLAGTVHLAYGGLPFAGAVVRRDGTLVHRSEWACATQIHQVADNLSRATARHAAGGRPRPSFSETLWTAERLEQKP